MVSIIALKYRNLYSEKSRHISLDILNNTALEVKAKSLIILQKQEHFVVGGMPTDGLVL